MQKFVFSLESLLKVNKIRKKKLEEDMTVAAKRLEEEQTLLSEIELEKASIKKKIEKLSAQGSRIFDLREYGFYFGLITKKMEAQVEKCSKLQEEWERKRSELVDIHNKIDVLERLKHEQYKQYIYELQKVEEKALEDIVNFKFMTRSEQTYG